MSDEERKRVIEEALHGAKVAVQDAPEPTKIANPCCDHCINKLGAVPMAPQSAPYNPYAGGPPAAPNPYTYGITTNSPFIGQNNYLDQLGNQFNNAFLNGVANDASYIQSS